MRELFLIAMELDCSPDSASESHHGSKAGNGSGGSEDYGHCENVAMQEANGMWSTDVFKEDIVKEQCMRRLGYAKGSPS